MKFFNGDKLEVVLKPTDDQVEQLVKRARELMAIKMNQWLLDQLTIEQLKSCIQSFQAEIEKRESGRTTPRGIFVEGDCTHDLFTDQAPYDPIYCADCRPTE